MTPREVLEEIRRHRMNCGPCMGPTAPYGSKLDATHAKWFHVYVMRLVDDALAHDERSGE